MAEQKRQVLLRLSEDEFAAYERFAKGAETTVTKLIRRVMAKRLGLDALLAAQKAAGVDAKKKHAEFMRSRQAEKRAARESEAPAAEPADA
jgi:hypothetical protein